MENKYIITLYNTRYDGFKNIAFDGNRTHAVQFAKDYLKSYTHEYDRKPYNDFFVESLSHWFIGHKFTQF